MAFDFAMSQLGRILPPAEEMKFRSPSGLESLVSAPLEPEDTLCERLNFGLHDEADVFRRGNKGTTMLGWKVLERIGGETLFLIINRQIVVEIFLIDPKFLFPG